jgi:hypothetical protein
MAFPYLTLEYDAAVAVQKRTLDPVIFRQEFDEALDALRHVHRKYDETL